MNPLIATLNGHFQELKANKRLQLGSLAILLIIFVEIGMNWSDRLVRQTEELNQLRAEIASLRQQSQNEAHLRETLTALDQLQHEVDERLWIVSSEAVGQAKAKDWINETLGRIGISNSTVNIATPRPALTKKAGPGSAHSSEESLLEFRATIGFGFSPESLENLLAELEGGEPFVAIDSLTVNKQTRRVELGIRLLMRIDATGTHPEPKVTS